MYSEGRPYLATELESDLLEVALGRRLHHQVANLYLFVGCVQTDLHIVQIHLDVYMYGVAGASLIYYTLQHEAVPRSNR